MCSLSFERMMKVVHAIVGRCRDLGLA